ncbi:MAG: glutathione S-transferase C-terminal domain-containing protein, partial [Cyanobacteriota bacterium]
MTIPAPVVRGVRCGWHWQWRQLMEGLGPADAEGNYVRPPGAFTAVPALPAAADLEAGHILIVGRSCPWAHRAWLIWSLRHLEDSIDLVLAHPDPGGGLWRLSPPFQGCGTLRALYRRAGAPAGSRATVPVLVGGSAGAVISNESARLMELLDRWPGNDSAAAGLSSGSLQPLDRQQELAQWRERLQHQFNDGVYRCGFARTQGAYDRAESALFSTLEALEAALADGRPWILGDALSLVDVQLFPTLIRWELVYEPLFGCSRRPLWQFPQLWRWRQRFFGLPGVAATCSPEAWRADYFGALFPLNPSGIVPAAPDFSTLVLAHPPAPGRHTGKAEEAMAAAPELGKEPERA